MVRKITFQLILPREVWFAQYSHLHLQLRHRDPLLTGDHSTLYILVHGELQYIAYSTI